MSHECDLERYNVTDTQVLFCVDAVINGALILPNLQIRDGVSFLQSDLKDLQGADERSQPREALLTAASHSHQQSIPPGTLQDPIDTATEAGEKSKDKVSGSKIVEYQTV